MRWPYVLKRSFHFHDCSPYICTVLKHIVKLFIECVHIRNNSFIAAFKFNKPVTNVIYIYFKEKHNFLENLTINSNTW